MRKARHLERADRYFKNGEYDQAKIEYLNVLRSDPANAHAYAQLGAMWADENVPLRSGAFLVKAKELAPHDIANRVRLARLYTWIGQATRAREEAQSILKESPGSGEALLILAQASPGAKEATELEEQVKKFPQQDSPYVPFALAIAALRHGDLTGAQANLDKVISIAPKLAEAHQFKGLLLAARGQDGSGDLKTAAELAPVRSLERLSYAESLMQAGKAEEAKAYLKTLTDQARDFVTAWGMQAKIALGQKKYDEVASLLENVFSRDPDNTEARLLQGQMLLEKGDVAKARDTLERLDRSHPDTPSVKNALAIMELRSGNTNAAIADLEQAINLNANYTDAILLLAELRIRTGNSAAAIDPLVKVVQRQPRLVRAQVLLADAYLNAGKFDEAATIFRKQIEANPKSSGPYALLGFVLERQKKLAEARKFFEKAVELDSKNLQAIDQLVNLDLADKAYDAAQKRVDALLQAEPKAAAAYLLQGKIDLAQKKFDPAIASLKKALDLNPNLAAPYELLVNIYLAQNRLPDALRELETITSKSPKNFPAFLMSGMIYDQLKDASKARDSYEKALAINPNSTQVLNNLAYIYSEKLTDLNKASDLARKAHTLAPADGAIDDTLGWISYKQGDYQQSLQLLQESAAKLPDNGEVQFHLGMSLYKMGKQKEAQAALEKAVSLSGEGEWKNEAKQRLALLSNKGESSGSSAELEKLIGGRADDPVALVNLGGAYEREGAPQKAAEAYEKALRANPKFIDAALKLAQLNAGPLKNKEKALDYAKKARELAPNDPKLTAEVGRLAFETGNFPWAYSLLQESARRLSDDSKVAHDLAWAAFAMGKLDEAQKAMERVSEGTPSSADAKEFLHYLSYLQEHRDAPEKEVAQTLSTNPNYAPALMARAQADTQHGEQKGAAAIYEEILQRYPDFAPAQKELAAIYAGDPQNLSKAQDLANKARRTLTADPVLDQTLGIIAYERKEYARAVQFLQNSQSKKALDAKGKFALGMAQFQVGQKDNASSSLKEALSQGLDGASAEEAKNMLITLEPTKKP